MHRVGVACCWPGLGTQALQLAVMLCGERHELYSHLTTGRMCQYMLSSVVSLEQTTRLCGCALLMQEAGCKAELMPLGIDAAAVRSISIDDGAACIR